MSSNLETVTVVMLDLFGLYVIYGYMHLFFKETRVSKKIEIIPYAMWYIALELVQKYAFYPIVNLIVTIVGYYIITLSYKSQKGKRMLAVALVALNGVLSELIVALTLNISGFDMLGAAKEHTVLTKFMTIGLQWIFFTVLSRNKNVKKDIAIPLRITLSAIAVCVLSYIVVVVIFIKSKEPLVIEVALVGMTTINISMVYLYDTLANVFNKIVEIEILKREKSFYHRQSEILRTNSNELSRYRHDIKNRLCVVEHMITTGNVEQAREYLHKHIDRLDDAQQFSKTGNIAIDSVINYKLSMAVSKGIQIKSDITSPREIHIEEDDVIVIIGNLLDNAIEAIEKVSENKKLELIFEYNRENIYILVENTYDGNINEGLRTTKQDKTMHGIGMRSIDSIIEKYNGKKYVEYDKEIFRIEIVM